MDEPSDGDIYAACSRRFESPEVRQRWLTMLEKIAARYANDPLFEFCYDPADKHYTEGE